MRWFKHDSDASQDVKLQKVKLRYGMEGYGLYWYCIELIVSKVETHNLTFELEHDAEILAHNTGINVEVLQGMIKYMIELGLFESSQGTITCLKIAKRLDQSMTSNPKMREKIKHINEIMPDRVMTLSCHGHDPIMTVSDKVMQEENRTDENRIEKKRKDENRTEQKKHNAPIHHLNEKTGKSFKCVKSNTCLIKARLDEGYTLQDILDVIDRKCLQWLHDDKMAEYLRPATLFKASNFAQYHGELTTPLRVKPASKQAGIEQRNKEVGQDWVNEEVGHA